MNDRRAFSIVLLAILVVLVLAAIVLSGWSFRGLIEALVVILLVVGLLHWLDRRRQASRH